MPYWRLFYHVVWGTKYREPLIAPEFERSLHNVIAAKALDLGGIVHAVGGTTDHIHLVVSVPPNIALSVFVGQVKGNSSHFVNNEVRLEHKFAWQRGYGITSFGERHLGWVVRYTHNQAQHHGQGTTIKRLERVTDT